MRFTLPVTAKGQTTRSQSSYWRLSGEPEVVQTEVRRIDTVIQHAAHNVRRGRRDGEVSTEVDPSSLAR